jgi:sulfonate transport system substrate-binding protein
LPSVAEVAEYLGLAQVTIRRLIKATITFIVASDEAISSKRAAVQDFVQRLNKARLWSLDHLPEYARSTAELTKLPENVLLSAYTAQRTSPIVIDAGIVREVQEASDRATRY